MVERPSKNGVSFNELGMKEVEEQISGLHSSKWTSFVNEVIVMKDGKVIKEYNK